MSQDVCVVYTDIFNWSRQDLAKQILSSQYLFEDAALRIKRAKLKPVWKLSTGDGFAVVFKATDLDRVIEFAANLLDDYSAEKLPQLRLAIAQGIVEGFNNAFTRRKDLTGPAVINARRILDGITRGSVLLIEEHLALQAKKLLPQYMIQFLVPHPVITDKHGDEHRVIQFSFFSLASG